MMKLLRFIFSSYRNEGVPALSVWKQLSLELWIGFFAAVIWTPIYFYYSYNPANDGNRYVYIIQGLFTSFFFVSVFTGHYIRVAKTLKTEYNFQKAENKSALLLAHITGGNSFCFIEAVDLDSNYQFIIQPVLVGEYPLSNLTINIVNFDESKNSKTMEIAELTKVNGMKYCNQLSISFPADLIVRTVYFSFYARNGVWNQELSFRKRGHIIEIGTTVRTNEFTLDDSNILHKNVYNLPIPAPPNSGPGSASSLVD